MLVVVGCCYWLLLVVAAGCCWLLLVVAGCWLLLVDVGCCCWLLLVVGCCWLAVVGKLSSVVVSDCRLSSGVVSSVVVWSLSVVVG